MRIHLSTHLEQSHKSTSAARRVSALYPITQGASHAPGQTLDRATQHKMEQRLGHDFRRVRVHSDPQAAAAAQAAGAAAYTVGRHIVFGRGRYQPQTAAGQRLLAHELTHVVQQGAVEPSGELAAGPAADSYERQAAAVAAAFDAGRAPPMVAAGVISPRVQCQPAGGGTPAASAWSSNLLYIGLNSDRTDCFGLAQPGLVETYSSCGSPVTPPFCQTARVPFEVEFLVDRINRPRPTPFTPPRVSVYMVFIEAGGQRRIIANVSDSAPRYLGPNLALAPSFGKDFPVGTAESGALTVNIALRDSSGVNIIFNDTIQFVITPCA